MSFIKKVNFKRVAIAYFIASIILVTACIVTIVYVMKDEIQYASEYTQIYKKVQRNGIDEDVTKSVEKLVKSFPVIRNGFILDKSGNISYKVNDNIVGDQDKFELKPYQMNYKYFEDNINNNIIYRVVEVTGFIVTENFIKDVSAEKNNHSYIDFFDDEDENSDISFVLDLTAKELKILNYIIDNKNGTRILLIREVATIPSADFIFRVIRIIITFVIACFWIGLALWVYKDADLKYINAPLWGLLVLLTNLVGLIVYIIIKQNGKVCNECGAIQGKDSLFCGKCGVKFIDTCQHCDGMLNRFDVYCTKCGNRHLNTL